MSNKSRRLYVGFTDNIVSRTNLAQNPDWADLRLEWQDNPGWNLEPEAQFRLKRKLPRK